MWIAESGNEVGSTISKDAPCSVKNGDIETWHFSLENWIKFAFNLRTWEEMSMSRTEIRGTPNLRIEWDGNGTSDWYRFNLAMHCKLRFPQNFWLRVFEYRKSLQPTGRKARATNKPECSHVKHLCETSYFNSFCTFFLCYRTSVDCGKWNGVERRVCSVQTVECWVGNVVSRIWNWDCGVWSVECKV